MIVGRGSGIISTLRANAGILRRKSSFRDIRQAYIKDIKMNSDKLDVQSLENFRSICYTWAGYFYRHYWQGCHQSIS